MRESEEEEEYLRLIATELPKGTAAASRFEAVSTERGTGPYQRKEKRRRRLSCSGLERKDGILLP